MGLSSKFGGVLVRRPSSGVQHRIQPRLLCVAAAARYQPGSSLADAVLRDVVLLLPLLLFAGVALAKRYQHGAWGSGAMLTVEGDAAGVIFCC